MKTYRQAEVKWDDDSYLDSRQLPSPLIADVFMNGSAATINLNRRGVQERIDRLTDAVLTEVGKDSVEIKGRSEFLAQMRLTDADQFVTVTVKVAGCKNC